jgi:PEP-CTERM motif
LHHFGRFLEEKSMRKCILAAAVSVAAGFGGLGAQWAAGAAFTSPLAPAILSVDINGGNQSDARATEGWNGSFSTPAFMTDTFGVTWSPWGGPTNTFGDGLNWPQNQSSQPPTVPNSTVGGFTAPNSFTKTFGSFTATVLAGGTASNYNATFPVTSRDRGIAGNYNGNTTAATGDTDMFRDFIFGQVTGSNVQSSNYLKITVGGLTPGTQYRVAGYSYDASAANSEAWTATAPTNGTIDWNDPVSGNFIAPADEQVLTWNGTPQAPVVFTLTADGNGNVSLYTWGGNGVTSNNSASNSYFNGLQVAAVPEPATIGMISLGALGMLSRRRRLA